MLLLVDNYDSFTYNLFHYLRELDAQVTVVRNDEISLDDALNGDFAGIVLSPGPCTPNEAGICLDLVAAAAGRIPVLGVCLGHQAIGQVMGGRVVRAPQVMHGKTSPVLHQGTSVFKGLPSPFEATRYHSLIVEKASLPDCLTITAETQDGIIMGMQHRDHALFGVQFHPESIASQHGHDILANFLRKCSLGVPA